MHPVTGGGKQSKKKIELPSVSHLSGCSGMIMVTR